MKRNKILILLILSLFISYSASSQIKMERINDGILFSEGSKKIAFYVKDAPKMNLDKGRANFFHPVYLPDGTVITENTPEDHIHHRGIFWAWHQLLINGEKVGDQWELKDFVHDVKSVEFFRLPDGKAKLKTIVNWESPNYKNGQEAFLQEKTAVTFWNEHKGYRIIQFEINLKALVDHVQLGGSDDVKGYGGFSTRIKLPEDVTFSSVEGGVEPQNEAVEAGKYINIHGSMAKKTGEGGILIYSANDFETANDWILRSKNSMQNAVWPGRKPVVISKNQPTVLRYALVLYTGKINEKKIFKQLEQLCWD